MRWDDQELGLENEEHIRAWIDKTRPMNWRIIRQCAYLKRALK